MRMLHLGLRVSDLEQSLAFYSALGYAELGSVPQTEFGSLTMLQLPDDPFVSLELVHHPERPVEDVGAVNHLVVQVDDLDATIADLGAKGVAAAPPAEPGPRIRTSWLTDPDGYRIELVQWPPGHPAGMTAADFAPDRGVKPALPVLESRERSHTGAARADLVPDLSRSTTDQWRTPA
jgi:lactoylglutathione lyase